MSNEALEPKVISQKSIDNHLDKINKGFYSDTNTIHEPILFLVSNVATSIFYLTISTYIFKKYNEIFNKHCFLIEYFTSLFICIFFILSVYVLTITGGRLAYTLGIQNISNNNALLLIISTLVAIFTAYITSILMTV